MSEQMRRIFKDILNKYVKEVLIGLYLGMCANRRMIDSILIIIRSQCMQ